MKVLTCWRLGPELLAPVSGFQQHQHQQGAIVQSDSVWPGLLAQVVAANTASRQQAAREAEVLLEQEQNAFEAWRDHLAAVPTIKVRHWRWGIASTRKDQDGGGTALRTLIQFPTSQSGSRRRASLGVNRKHFPQLPCFPGRRSLSILAASGLAPFGQSSLVLLTQALRMKAEVVRSAELDRLLKSLPDTLTNKQRKSVEQATRSLMDKLLHGPMASLRCDGSDSEVGCNMPFALAAALVPRVSA